MATFVTPVATITTASDILFALKRVFVANQAKHLRMVRTFKLGILPPQPNFPVLNIMPENETYVYEYNGGKYQVLRDYLVEVFSKSRSPAEAMEETRDIIGFAKQIIKENITIGTESIDLEIYPRVFEEVRSFQGQYVQLGVLPIRAVSYEFLPSNRKTVDHLIETTSSDLIKAIYNVFDNYRRLSGPLSLKEIVQLEKSRIPPIPKFPALTLIEPHINQDREYAGLDSGGRLFEISLWNRLLDKDHMLTSVLRLLEVVKDIIQINHLWGGRCLMSTISSVNFERKSLQVGKVYQAIIRMQTHSQEVNPNF